MHIQTDVVVQPDFRLAGVDPHTDAHVHVLGRALGGKRSLPATAAAIASLPREGDEEGVALGVDLAAVVLVERRPQHALMSASTSA